MKEVEIGNLVVPQILLDQICEAAYREIKKWAAEQEQEEKEESK